MASSSGPIASGANAAEAGRGIPRIFRGTSTPVFGKSFFEAAQKVHLRRNASAEAGLCLKSQLVPFHPKFGTWGSVRRIALFLGRWPAGLMWWLGVPGKWAKQAFRLVLFVILMLPGFIPPFLSYLTSKQVIKNIAYGPCFRHQLDVYLPCKKENSGEVDSPKAPVVIFVSGGAWVIGYKMWAFIMGQLFQQRGVLFIAPDYRNFPETTVGGMVDDVIHAVGWVFENIQGLNGDPANVTLMGQSAGAHISAMALLEQATRGALSRQQGGQAGPMLPTRAVSVPVAGAVPANGGGSLPPQWHVESVARWVGISGPYDIMEFVPQVRRRGLPKRIMFALMEQDYARFSPMRRVRDLSIADPLGIARCYPACHIFHGTADKAVSWKQSEAYAETLLQAGIEATTKFYAGKSHTDPILEDPCEGDSDELMSDLLALVSPKTCGDSVAAKLWCTQPKLLLKWAKICNPF